MGRLEKAEVELLTALRASGLEEVAGRHLAYRPSKMKVSNISRTISMARVGGRWCYWDMLESGLVCGVKERLVKKVERLRN